MKFILVTDQFKRIQTFVDAQMTKFSIKQLRIAYK